MLGSWICSPPTQAEFLAIDYSAYHLRDDFLSAAEHEFFDALRSVLGDEMVICPKVSLGGLFYAKTGDYAQNLSARNRTERKHVDFLLCDPTTIRLLLGVELDDKSHQREDRRERDQLVDGVFTGAGLPVHRIQVQRLYEAQDLRKRLGACINAGRG